MAAAKDVTACLIIIGNEVLSGRTKDANLHFLAGALTEMGIRLREARVIGDDEQAIIAAVNACRAAYDYVFTTGGIGPTHDDITAESIAKAFDVPLLLHPEARARLEAHYPPGELNEARLRMARVPEGGILIDNPVSTAPGFQIGNVFVMAGVPRIMQAMFEGIRHRLRTGAVMLSHTITIYKPEGALAAGLAEVQAQFPDVEIGSYPFAKVDALGAAIVLRCPDATRLTAAAEAVRALARALGAEPEETHEEKAVR